MQLQLKAMRKDFSIYGGICSDTEGTEHTWHSKKHNSILGCPPCQTSSICPKTHGVQQGSSPLISFPLVKPHSCEAVPRKSKRFLLFLFEAGISPLPTAKFLSLFLIKTTFFHSQFCPVNFCLPSLYQQDHLLQLTSFPKHQHLYF